MSTRTHAYRSAPCPNTIIAVHHSDPLAIPPAPVPVPVPVHLIGSTIRPRAARWPQIAALAVMVALLGAAAWTAPATRTAAEATVVAGRTGQ